MLRGSQANAGLVPRSIGEQLVGREFRNFDHFRRKYWKMVASSEYASSFDKQAQFLMKRGNAPPVDLAQALGDRKVYELHHLLPIENGGGVYDVSNLVIATPRFHVRMLHNFGGR